VSKVDFGSASQANRFTVENMCRRTRVKLGYLKFYSEQVVPASEGAVMPRF
jgi:hypothetical protein